MDKITLNIVEALNAKKALERFISVPGIESPAVKEQLGENWQQLFFMTSEWYAHIKPVSKKYKEQSAKETFIPLTLWPAIKLEVINAIRQNENPEAAVVQIFEEYEFMCQDRIYRKKLEEKLAAMSVNFNRELEINIVTEDDAVKHVFAKLPGADYLALKFMFKKTLLVMPHLTLMK